MGLELQEPGTLAYLALFSVKNHVVFQVCDVNLGFT